MILSSVGNIATFGVRELAPAFLSARATGLSLAAIIRVHPEQLKLFKMNTYKKQKQEVEVPTS